MPDGARRPSDPIDTAVVVKRLLDASAGRDFASAQEHAALLRRVVYPRHAWPVLARAAEGCSPVCEREGAYFVAPPSHVPLEALTQTLRAALDTLSDLVAQPPPLVIVDFHDGGALENMAARDGAALSRLRLSVQLFKRPDWRAIVWHEAGHAVLAANCRFLDEGWAVWCQVRSGRRFDFPAPSEKMGAWRAPAAIDEIPVSAFLANAGADLAFSDIVDDDVERAGVYMRALRYVSCIIDRHGVEAFTRLFRMTAESGDACATVTTVFGETPEALDVRSCAPSLAGIERGFHQVRMQRKRHAAEPFLDMARRVADGGDNVQALLLLAKLLINKITTAAELRVAPPDIETTLQELHSVIERIDQLTPQNKTCAMLKILRNMSAAPGLAGAEFAALMMNIENDMRKLLQTAPDNAELLLCLARMELSKPAHYSDRAAALRYLAKAAEDAGAVREAVAIARTIP